MISYFFYLFSAFLLDHSKVWCHSFQSYCCRKLLVKHVVHIVLSVKPTVSIIFKHNGLCSVRTIQCKACYKKTDWCMVGWPAVIYFEWYQAYIKAWSISTVFSLQASCPKKLYAMHPILLQKMFWEYGPKPVSQWDWKSMLWAKLKICLENGKNWRKIKRTKSNARKFCSKKKRTGKRD